MSNFDRGSAVTCSHLDDAPADNVRHIIGEDIGANEFEDRETEQLDRFFGYELNVHPRGVE